MDEKAIQLIKTYVKGKIFLIVDNTSVGKQSIKKMLAQTAVNKKNILSAQNFDEAIEIIKNHRPEWIFTNFMLNKETYDVLLDLHLQLRPERLSSGFILMSENDSLEIATRVAQSDVDRLVLVPFTVAGLQQEFIKALIPKAQPSPYQVQVEMGKSHLLSDPDRALQYFEKAKRLDKKSPSAHYYEGMIYLKQKSLEKARECFETALKIQPVHYQSLTELFKILLQMKHPQKAYRVARTLLDNFPVNPELIPKYSWLSVACAQYDDVFEYHDAFKKVSEPDDDMKNYIAASLTIFGKKVIQDKFRNEKETDDELYSKALDVIDAAGELCSGKPLIFAGIIEALKEAKEIEKMDYVLAKALNQFPNSIEIKILELVAFDLKAKAQESLKRALDMVQAGTKAFEIYEIIVRRSIEMSMPRPKVEDYYQQAISEFPNKTDVFNELAKDYLNL